MTFLHTNDLHGKLKPPAAELVASLRETADFYFDSGDAVASGNVAIPLAQEPVWRLLKEAGCDAGVPGNREFHITAAGMRAKLAGCGHPLLAANLLWKNDGPPLQSIASPETGHPLPSVLELSDVSVFGVMTPMVTARMAARHLSAFINESPIIAAQRCVEKLRDKSRTIICLTHLGLKADIALAETVGGIDIIFGGHSHDLIAEPLKVRDTYICQSGSHAKYVGRYVYEKGTLSAEFIELARGR